MCMAFGGPPATELACHPRHGDPDLFVAQALTGRSISNEPHCLPLGENAWLPDRGWSPLGLPELGTRRHRLWMRGDLARVFLGCPTIRGHPRLGTRAQEEPGAL